jgi:hypothetical protein
LTERPTVLHAFASPSGNVCSGLVVAAQSGKARQWPLRLHPPPLRPAVPWQAIRQTRMIVMEDDLLDVITVATTGNVCFFIAVIFDVHTIPACAGLSPALRKRLSSGLCIHVKQEGLLLSVYR